MTKFIFSFSLRILLRLTSSVLRSVNLDANMSASAFAVSREVMHAIPSCNARVRSLVCASIYERVLGQVLTMKSILPSSRYL